nr:hypothetical protein [Mixta theicola]
MQKSEFSTEFKGLHHTLSILTDNITGKPTGTHQQSSIHVINNFDYSRSYRYKAAATGQALQKSQIELV